MEERILERPRSSTDLDVPDAKPLDSAFNSIINRLPDLCMQPVPRWAGEDNFFNKTKSLKLEPFKRQSYFDRCISPTLVPTDRREPATASSGSSGCGPARAETKPQTLIKSSGRIRDSSSPSDRTSPDGGRCTEMRPKVGGEQVRKLFDQDNKKAALEERNRIRRKYSRIRIKRSPVAGDSSPGGGGGGGRIEKPPGYDRLFSGVLSEGYPYANPIPRCMLTEQNIDNLREIIVSSTDIEWKMLTPVRPESDYEERFFDKLIHLHRCRYQARLELGYFDSDHRRVPFKHTRHPYMIHYPTKARNAQQQQQLVERSPLLSGARKVANGRGNRLSTGGFCAMTNAKLRKHAVRRRSSVLVSPAANSGLMAGNQLMIPALTLTTEFEANEPIEQLPDADFGAGAGADESAARLAAESSKQQQQQPAAAAAGDGRGEFSYELFSRFSRKNQEIKQQKLQTTAQSRHEQIGQIKARNDGPPLERSQSEESLLEAQLDEIVGHLMSNTSSIID